MLLDCSNAASISYNASDDVSWTLCFFERSWTTCMWQTSGQLRV